MRQQKHQPHPITSKAKFKQVDERRKEINRLNRQRAKAMEKRVARYLDGVQTPQSGAGSAKGDILIDFKNRPGKYMIECKMTSTRVKDIPKMQISKSWIPKMKKDAYAMRALFPILVYHYHDKAGDYVIINCDDLRKLNIYPENINTEVPKIKEYNTSAKSVVIFATFADLCKTAPFYSLLWIDNVVYYHMTLEYFRDIVGGI
jgi:hypothetical protein